MPEALEEYVYTPLRDKCICVGVTGSSSVYRSIDLVRELRRMGAEVRVVASEAAAELVGPKLWEWAAGSPPVTEVTGEVEHIGLADKCDAMVVAPATLNTMAKMAAGISDTPVTLASVAFRGREKPVIVVPAMNMSLYRSPHYRDVEERLIGKGYYIVPPRIEGDKAKYPPLRDLAHCIDALISRGRDLDGVSAIVTAGPTYEYLDPVRIITNPSTGYMGVLAALELACRGAHVTLVHGPMKTEPPYLTENIPVTTTLEMSNTVKKLIAEREYAAAVFAAAPADYRPARRYHAKIPTSQGPLDIRLLPTPKVIRLTGKRPPITIGFAAETTRSTEELIERAREKLEKYSLTYIVANIVGRNKGFGDTRVEACIVAENEHRCIGEAYKQEIARVIGDLIATAMRGETEGNTEEQRT